ncbi:MAG: hypothetical protein RL328_2369, partial [Acidobacteriota bacterium]
DLALDEPRGRLYVANFTANRIEVISLATKAVLTTIAVAPHPNSISISPDGRWLATTHYGNNTAPTAPSNSLTILDLTSGGAPRTFTLANPPLGLAFGLDNKALVVTTKEFLLLNPVTGDAQQYRTFTEQATKSLPVPLQTFPPQITQASVGASPDGRSIWGFADKLMFQYDVVSQAMISTTYFADPAMGPRAISVSADGGRAALGWIVADIDRDFPRFYGSFGAPLGSLVRGGHAVDSLRNLVYSEVPSTEADPPVLTVRDLDNLTLRERLQLPEHLAGRAVVTADGATMYAVSDSGVTVLPVGNRNLYPRLESTVEDLLFTGNFCDRNTATKTFTVRDPGGARVPFSITSSHPGVKVSTNSSTTPAVVTVTVDPNAFAAQKGTVSLSLTLTSDASVNLIDPIRVLVNSREPDQRGTIVNSPGKLIDLVADPVRDQYYALRKDQNRVLVYNGANNTVKATLRTCNVPTGMTVTADRRYLLVSCEDAQIITVYNLDTLQAMDPINAQNTRMYSIAASSKAILGVARDTENGQYAVYSIDLATRIARRLTALGIWKNELPKNTVAIPAVNGSSILFASADGSVLLYDAALDTFTVSRKDLAGLTGPYAASTSGDYVIGNRIFNPSLVPVRTITPTTGGASGFTFVARNGFFASAETQSGPGILSRVNAADGVALQPTRTAEAPLLPTTNDPFTRTAAVLNTRGTILLLTQSGIEVLPADYDAAVTAPKILSVVSAADGVSSVAPGGLFTIWGSNLSAANLAANALPLPTVLGDSCLTVNDQPTPLLFVSPGQVNAQMSYQNTGAVKLAMHTPSGVSPVFDLTVKSSAPSVFRAAVAPGEVFPTIVRTANNLMATDSNPIRRNEVIVIYLTGLGGVTNGVTAGQAAPGNPPAQTLQQPEVTIGGVGAPVLFSGLTPGLVGLYQINLTVPGSAPKGLGIPLTIVQGGVTHTVNVRVVE